MSVCFAGEGVVALHRINKYMRELFIRKNKIWLKA